MDKLVNYSSSSDDEPPAPKKCKLPVPFEKPKIVEIETSTKEHEGRKRQIKHVEGNWASHIFIELEENLIQKLRLKNVEEELSNVRAIESPHVSLSKMFILQYHWIDNFSKNLIEKVKFESFPLAITDRIIYLSNDDKSRYFACLLIEESCGRRIRNIIDCIDSVLKEFQLPVYYENSIIHLSMFWKLSEFSDYEKEIISNEVNSLMSNELNLFSLVDKITFKTGNKIKYLHSLK